MENIQPLPRSFYNRDATTVAKALLGKILVREINGEVIKGMIIETESYLGEHDAAAHVAKGRTKRTEVIYGEAGHAYVYVIHGHHALNIVCSQVNDPASVLIRSLDWVSGPGRLTRKLQIDKSLYGADVTTKQAGLYICDNPKKEQFDILATPRIGVRDAVDWLLRFVVKISK